MKVLYALANYPQLSETYITAEIDYVRAQGVEVEVWSPCGADNVPAQVPVHRGDLLAAAHAFKPNVVHAHYLIFAGQYAAVLAGTGLPMTVRGHSFDFTVGRVAYLSGLPAVRHIYLFPHFARQMADNHKVCPLPVAYSSGAYGPAEKDRKLVLRLAAGKPGKGLEDFFKVAELCPGWRFVLGVARVHELGHYIGALQTLRAGCKAQVSLVADVPWPDAVRYTRSAGIYLDTAAPGAHPFGQPISVAEALATGAYALVRREVGAAEYIGPAGELYDTPAEAAALVRATALWDDAAWGQVAARAVAQARGYADTAVLGRLVADWGVIHAGG